MGYFDDLCSIDTQEQVEVHMGGFGGIWRDIYCRGEPSRSTVVEVTMKKIKNGKVTSMN